MHYQILLKVKDLELVDLIMDKYDENKEMPLHKICDKEKYLDDTIKAAGKMKKYYSDYFKDQDKFKKEHSNFTEYFYDTLREACRTTHMKPEDIWKEMLKTTNSDWENEIREDGIYGKYNENGHYDYYTVGGRWKNTLVTINEKGQKIKVDAAQKKDIHWDKMLPCNKTQIELYSRIWDISVEGKKIRKNEIGKICQKNKETMLYKYGTKENYMKHINDLCFYSYVDETGWYEKETINSTGYRPTQEDYALSEIKWESEFYDRFIKDADPNDWFVVLDCHD